MNFYISIKFCPFWRDCSKINCPEALTDEVLEMAKKYNTPICQYKDKPKCFIKKSK